MRIMSLLAVCAMVWAVSAGTIWTHVVPEGVPPTGELTLCIVPMGPTAMPFGSCSDRPSTWTGVGGELNPE